MSVEIDLHGGNGDVLAFREFGSDYLLTPGLVGTGLLGRELSSVQGAASGSTVRGSRAGDRLLLLPLLIGTATRTEFMAALRRFSNAVRVTDPVSPPRLVWRTEVGDEFSIDVFYISGADVEWSAEFEDVGTRRVAPTFRCPRPYWEMTDPINLPTYEQPVAETLLPDLALLQLSSSSVFGDATVVNPGDVEAPVVWIVTGPAATSAFTRADGLGFTLGAITAGEVITVDTRSRTVTDQTGANRYDLLGSAPKLFHLLPGTSQVSLVATGTDSGSRITGYFYPRVETVF